MYFLGQCRIHCTFSAKLSVLQIKTVEGHLYVRISAGICNELSDYEKLASAAKYADDSIGPRRSDMS
eukprot:SAG31_NODE_26561_length_440_cov_0.847507_1_plen_67_part_00